MNGRIATIGSSSEAPSVTSTEPGAAACSNLLCASSWNSDGIAHNKGTTASNSSTSAPLQVPICDEGSAPASSDCVPMYSPPTMAAAQDSISSSTVMPKLAGSPALISSSAMKPGVYNIMRTSRAQTRASRSGGRTGSTSPSVPTVGLTFDILCHPMLSVIVMKGQVFCSLHLVIFELSEQPFVRQVERMRILPVMMSNFRQPLDHVIVSHLDGQFPATIKAARRQVDGSDDCASMVGEKHLGVKFEVPQFVNLDRKSTRLNSSHT